MLVSRSMCWNHLWSILNTYSAWQGKAQHLNRKAKIYYRHTYISLNTGEQAHENTNGAELLHGSLWCAVRSAQDIPLHFWGTSKWSCLYSSSRDTWNNLFVQTTSCNQFTSSNKTTEVFFFNHLLLNWTSCRRMRWFCIQCTGYYWPSLLALLLAILFFCCVRLHK